MAETETPGASLAIAVDGQLVRAVGYGVKHEEEEPDCLIVILQPMETSMLLLRIIWLKRTEVW
jgi:hypothetical protein